MPRARNWCRKTWTAVLAALLHCALPTAADGYGIRTDRAAYDHGDTIVIHVDLGGLDSGEIEVIRGEELYRNVSYSGDPYWYGLPGDGQLRLELPASAILWPLGSREAEQDPLRAAARIVLYGTLKDRRTRVEASTWVTVTIKTPAAPGALQLGGRTQVLFGEPVDVVLADLPGLLADSAVPPFGDGRLALELVRMGRVLPGGAVQPDRVMGREVDLWRTPQGVVTLLNEEARWALEQAGHRLDERSLVYDMPGFYELRLTGRGETVLDRLPFEVVVPDAIVSLRLDPAVEGAFDYRRPPLVSLLPESAFARLWPGWTDSLALTAVRAEPGSPVVNGASGRFLSDDFAAGRPILDLAFTSGGLRPGPYRLLLSGLASDPDRLRQARLASAVFEIGGDYPGQWLPRRQEPPLSPGDVQLVLEPGDAVPVGTAMTARAVAPGGIDLDARGAWFEVAYAPEVLRYGCHVFDRIDPYVYQIGRLRAAGGTATFLAPAIPETFELRLFEENGHGEPVLLAARPFGTALPALPAALSLAGSPTVGEPVTVHLAVPPDAYWSDYAAELWLSAQVAPGGAEQPPKFVSTASEEAAGGRTFPPVYVPGLYEVRLVARQTRSEPAYGSYYHDPYYVGRLAFGVAAPALPPLPADAGFAPAPALDDWPQAEDPRRGLAAWQPTPADCLPPAIPAGAELSVVEFHNGALADPADDRYLPVSLLMPGRTYQVQARFPEAPPAESYEVTLGDGLRLTVARTAEPRLYRSSYFTLTAPQAVP
jgi:hypothetical protein